MRNLPFTLRQLEIFECLSESRSFRNAAERLGISQAAVSSQLQVLEVQLGVRLFERRSGKRPSLTNDGQSFLADLYEFRTAAGKLADHRKIASATPDPARFRILIGKGLMDGYIRPKLDEFYYSHPEIECDFVTQIPDEDKALKRMSGEGFDCALIHAIDGTQLDGNASILGRIRGGIFGHSKFADGEDLPLDVERLSRLPFILPPIGSPGERAALTIFRAHRIQPFTVVSRPQYYDVIASMVARGLGIALLPEALLSLEARHDTVLLYRLSDWHLVWCRRPEQIDPRLTTLEEFLISAVLNDPRYPAVTE